MPLLPDDNARWNAFGAWLLRKCPRAYRTLMRKLKQTLDLQAKVSPPEKKRIRYP